MSAKGGIVSMDAGQFDELMAAAAEFPGDAEREINAALRDAAPGIRNRIDALIHPSGRIFKGHARSAKGSAWQRYEYGSLSVTVATNGDTHYLYFPDDGTNTRRHAGNQRFFERGAQAYAPQFIDDALKRLTNDWS